MSDQLSLLKSHLSWQMTSVMREICEPIYSNLGVNYVDYARYYTDGRLVTLFTDKDYVSSFANNITVSPGLVLCEGMHLWSEYIPKDFLSFAEQKYQHSHGMTILSEHSDHTEIFNFATNPENTKILSFYLNQQVVLQQILTFIRARAKKHLHKLEDSPLVIPKLITRSSPTDKINQILMNVFQVPDSFQICINNVTIDLSKREAQCLHYLHQGKTAKEIAKELDISHRTIEIYLDNVRSKTASKNRVELISKITRNQLENLAIAL